MERSSNPADVLVRFFIPGWQGKMPSALYDRRGTYQPDDEWRERNAEAVEHGRSSEPVRVVNDLRSASCFNLLRYDLAGQGYVLTRVNLHEVQQRQGGKQWMVTLGFTHRSAQPEAWRNREVVDWIESQFVGTTVGDVRVIGTEDTSLRVALVSVVAPRDTLSGKDAILVNVLSPEPAKEGAPVFQLRLDANGFWVQDPDDPQGSKEILVEEANLRSLRFAAPERAKNNAGQASNRVLRNGFDVSVAKAAACAAALEVFTACGFEDAETQADAIVASFDWEKKVARFAAR